MSNHEGGGMEKKSLQEDYMWEETWQRNHEEGFMKHLGGTWEHLRGIWEPPGRYLAAWIGYWRPKSSLRDKKSTKPPRPPRCPVFELAAECFAEDLEGSYSSCAINNGNFIRTSNAVHK